MSCASHLLLDEKLYVYHHVLFVVKLLEFMTGDMGSAFDLDHVSVALEGCGDRRGRKKGMNQAVFTNFDPAV